MKSTGVIRRIDELGRIVIPKEIRKNLNIREGENLEIIIDNNNIILTKHSPLFNIENIIQRIKESLSDIITDIIIITDREKIVASSDVAMLNKEIKSFVDFIDNREIYISKELESFNLDEEKITGYFTIVPVIASSDCFGLVIIVSQNNLKRENELLGKLAAKIISNKIDIS